MRTHRPVDMDATGPIQLPGSHLRDAGRKRITGATSWSAVGGVALAVTFGALFAQTTANAEAEKAPTTPVNVANTEEATETTAPTTAAAPHSAAAPHAAAPQAATAPSAKPAAPRTSAAKPAAPKVIVNPTDEPDAPAPPAAAPKATTSDAPADASSGAT